jgi:HD-like signal output (HDOD) protein
MPALSLDQLAESVNEIPPMPAVAVRTMQMTTDPNVGPRELAAVVSADVALSARVLRIANSAYYGMPRKISTVSEAVLLLGMKAMHSLAVAAAAYDTLAKNLDGYGLPSGELWRHSVSCGVAAQVIARRTRAVATEEAFTAGLLHDVGKVILSIYVAQQMQAILALVELEECPFYAAERTVLGFDHADVGSRVAERWNLPAPLCQAIRGHHEPQACDPLDALTAVVHVANSVCHREGIGLRLLGPQESVAEIALERLKMDRASIDDVASEMAEHLRKSDNVANMMRVA